MGINGLLEFSTVIGAILFLLPLFMGCVLFFLVIWMIIRNKRNETNKRVEVALAAIEKNPGIDVEELLKKVTPKQKSLKEKLVNKLQWGTMISLVGLVFIGFGAYIGYEGGWDLVFIGFGAYIGYEGGWDADDPVVATVFGSIILAVGVAFFINYFIAKKMLAKEIEAEERQLSQQA